MHDEVQTKYLVPVVHEAWKKEQQRVVQLLKAKDSVALNRDGRCDSPGYAAKYCTYSLMHAETELIAQFELVHVKETTSSVRMECVGFERCLDSLMEAKVSVASVATYRHVVVRSLDSLMEAKVSVASVATDRHVMVSLDSLMEAKVSVPSVATDRHVVVRSLMKKKFADKGAVQR